jgi:hypothetical protein
MVQDDELVGLDGVRVVFDDDRVVSDAGIALVATLAGRLGIERLVGRFVRLRREVLGACNAGRKVMALIYAMVLGADCIDDCEVLVLAAHADFWVAGCRHHQRWGHSCERSLSAMCVSSIACSQRH